MLDLATGDGRWLVAVAKQYPKATFVGTDIVPKHFEELEDLPSSISFKTQSVLEDWSEKDHKHSSLFTNDTALLCSCQRKMQLLYPVCSN